MQENDGIYCNIPTERIQCESLYERVSKNMILMRTPSKDIFLS